MNNCRERLLDLFVTFVLGGITELQGGCLTMTRYTEYLKSPNPLYGDASGGLLLSFDALIEATHSRVVLERSSLEY